MNISSTKYNKSADGLVNEQFLKRKEDETKKEKEQKIYFRVTFFQSKMENNQNNSQAPVANQPSPQPPAQAQQPPNEPTTAIPLDQVTSNISISQTSFDQMQLEEKSTEINTIFYLERMKKLTAINKRLNFLEDLHSQTLQLLSGLYLQLGFAEGKNRWRNEFEEKTNPQDFQFFLHQHPDIFFDPSKYTQAEQCIEQIRQAQQQLSDIEREQREIKLKQQELTPEVFYKEPKPTPKPKPQK